MFRYFSFTFLCFFFWFLSFPFLFLVIFLAFSFTTQIQKRIARELFQVHSIWVWDWFQNQCSAMEFPARQCSDYIVVLKHLERKHERLSAYCLDLIGALLYLFKKDTWRVVERAGFKFQFRNLPVHHQVLFTGFRRVFAQRIWGFKGPFESDEGPLEPAAVPEPTIESEEDSSSGSLGSSAVFPKLPGCILRRGQDFPNLRTLAAFQDVEEGGGSESIEVDELVEADEVEDTVGNVQAQFDSVADDWEKEKIEWVLNSLLSSFLFLFLFCVFVCWLVGWCVSSVGFRVGSSILSGEDLFETCPKLKPSAAKPSEAQLTFKAARPGFGEGLFQLSVASWVWVGFSQHSCLEASVECSLQQLQLFRTFSGFFSGMELI